MRLIRGRSSLAAAVLAASVPSLVNCDEHSSINVALKASFQPAPYLLELLYAHSTLVPRAAEG